MRYTVYGLTLETPFACPIVEAAAEEAAPDVLVLEAETPRNLPDPCACGPGWEAAPGKFLFRAGARAGRFLAVDGRRVTFERGRRASDEMLAFHFLDTVLAALLQQRGLLVLHATAAVLPNRNAVAVAGESGAGKTTALAALLKRGCAMLSDDITALQWTPERGIEALPGIPQYHLTDESAAGLGHNLEGLPRYPWKRMKAAVPAAEVMTGSAAKLDTIYWIATHPSAETLRVSDLHGTEKFNILQKMFYFPSFQPASGDMLSHFSVITAHVRIRRILRPAQTWTGDEIAAIVEGAG